MASSSSEFFISGNLTVPSLQQQALVIISEVLINRHHEEFNSISLASCKIGYAAVMEDNWHQRWTDFKTRISGYIEQLRLPNYFKIALCQVMMCLYRNARDFARYTGLGPAVKRRFTARGDMDVNRTMEEYMVKTLPRLPHKMHKYEFLRDACHLCQDRCVQLILCELLKGRKSPLEPLLRNAKRVVELRGYWDCDISLVLDDVIYPFLWADFVSSLNNKHLNCVKFAFEQNTLKVFSKRHYSCLQMKLFWPKMTATQKSERAEVVFEAALYTTDVQLLVQTMPYLDSAEIMQQVTANLLSFILCFLKEPYDRYDIPDLQLAELDMHLLEKDEENLMYWLLLDIILEGDFCFNAGECFLQLYQYIASRDLSLADHMNRCIVKSFRKIQGNSTFSDWPCDSARRVISRLGIPLPKSNIC